MGVVKFDVVSSSRQQSIRQAQRAGLGVGVGERCSGINKIAVDVRKRFRGAPKAQMGILIGELLPSLQRQV